MKEKESKLKVRAIYKQGGQIITEEDKVDEVEVMRIDDEAPTVTISLDKTMTLNLGNYESLKIGGFISVPAYLDDESIDRAFEYARRKLDENLIKVVEDEGQAK